MKKRLCIYATYDKQGYIEEYVEYCLKQLSTVADCLMVVSNNLLDEESKGRLGMVNRIYERSDIGYDMGGFSHVITDLLARDELKKYDELILLNDSIFGPFYSLTDIFESMDKQCNLDFWGITKRGISDFDGGEKIYSEHIQLYFYVIRERMLHSSEFVNYWTTISQQVTDFRSAIINYEFAFTEYFQNKGYRWDVYCHTDEYITDCPKLNLSPYHYSSYELIRDKKCPFLKRKLFTGDFIESKYTDKSDLRRAFMYIEECTQYDVDLIWKHILRVYHLGDIMNSLQMYRVINEENILEDKTLDLIQIIDLGDAELEKQQILKDAEDAPYVLFLNVRNQKEAQPLKQAKRRCIIENLYPEKGYCAQIVRLFNQFPKLGLLIPPLKTFGVLEYSLEKKWRDEEVAIQLYNENNLQVPFKKECAPIHEIDGFWCRRELLNDNIIENLKNSYSGTMMQMMPLIAQEKGYYTEIVINKEYVSSHIINLQNVACEIWNSIGIESSMNADIESMKDLIFRKKLLSFYDNNRKLYIYGAGQLAYRAIKIIEEFGTIEGIVVSDKNGNPKELGGYCIQSIDDICVDNCSFVIAVGKKNTKTVKNKLTLLGVTDYMIFC